MPGGSKFMRNAPVPLEAIFPHGAWGDTLQLGRHLRARAHSSLTPRPLCVAPLRAGIPPEYNIVYKDVNGIQVTQSAQPEGMKKVLIDFSSKTAT